MRGKIVATLLLCVSGALTALFVKLAVEGSVGWHEPNTIILSLELTLFSLITLFALYNFLKEAL